MAFQFDDNPEDLVRLRDTVKVWLDKAVTAVFSFDQENNGVFKLTSDGEKIGDSNDDFSLTTNARCYMALINAFRFLDDKKRFNELETSFFDFLFELYSCEKNIGSDINNNFKLAHFMDFVFVEQFLRAYDNGDENKTLELKILVHINKKRSENKVELKKFQKWLEGRESSSNGKLNKTPNSIVKELSFRIKKEQEKKKAINFPNTSSLVLDCLNMKLREEKGAVEKIAELNLILKGLGNNLSKQKREIRKLLKSCLSDYDKKINSTPSKKRENSKGNLQMKFLDDEADSHHFFVTLHVLRAINILSPDKPIVTEFQKKCAKHAEMFCREQYSYRHGKKHCLDIFRLVFAITIYAIYEKHPDKSLIKDVIEIISDTQQASGNWPSTHPIPRSHKKPWYITTHEIPLCLTWLYFQPRVPDVARPLLLAMMEKYFNGWVIPTYQRIHDCKGWFDESLNGKHVVTGWATGVVCHFLANYCAVLNDHINRRVIESLNLQACSDRYLIDETAIDRNLKWDNC